MADSVAETCLDPILPPPPAIVPPNVILEKPHTPRFSLMSRKGFGRSGKPISLQANHFKVAVTIPDAVFYQYSVTITYEDGKEVNAKTIGRKLIDRLYQTYCSEFSDKQFIYDGEKSLYTVGALPQKKAEFTVVLEESSAKKEPGSPKYNGSQEEEGGKRSKRSFNSKTFKIAMSYAAKIPMKSIVLALKGADVDNGAQDALRVLDIILRQQAAKSGCLLVRQSFFHDDTRNFTDVGGGVTGVRGFHASFRPTQDGLSLNMDVSTTMILQPGPVLDFLRANQGVRDNRYIDWTKAKRMLKNMRIKTRHRDSEFKIIGLSEKPCTQLYFPLKVRNGGSGNEGETTEVTVYDYFSKSCGIDLHESANMPCLIVGRPKHPSYLPLELCSLISLQRYTKALSSVQRSTLVEKSRQKPQEKAKVLTDSVRNYYSRKDSLLGDCGITIENKLTQIDGRVLDPPKLKFGNNAEMFPNNGRWNLNNKTVLEPVTITRWVVVNFSARCDMSQISRDLISCGRKKGINIDGPHTLIEEDQQSKRAPPAARVEKMFERIREKLPGPPTFILCILSERKNSDVYGPWKKKCLCDFGIVSQCISPMKVNDQYLTNLLLKINAKLGGMNSLLVIESPSRVPVIKDTPTLILGMDVSHGSPGRSDVPSIAAVVGSRCWPSISRYGAAVRTQSPKVEVIDALYKPQANGSDEGIISELLVEFYRTSNGRKPTQIVIFRDGVSESQFNQVLNIEVDQIVKAYQHLGETSIPKFTVIVAQKNHHTKIFQANDPSRNIPPGTVVDSRIVHPRNYDFYLCSHMGMIGTSRPAHYHVLIDEIGFSPDDLQNFIHSLSYVYQRSTTAVSIVAPISYSHLAAYQMGQFMKLEDFSDNSSENKSISSMGSVRVPDLPRMHENVRNSMFFC